jgi:hypothetical protein
MSDEMTFLREIKRLRSKGQTFRQGPAACPYFLDFCAHYLEGLELRTAGWKRHSTMDEDDRARLQAWILRETMPAGGGA